MRELLLRIRTLLLSLQEGRPSPLSAAAAVALCLMEEGDLYLGSDAVLPVGEVFQDAPDTRYVSAVWAAGAAYALNRNGNDRVAVALVRNDKRLEQDFSLAVSFNLPLCLLVDCTESELADLSQKVMAHDISAVPADGRDVMRLMPSLRQALDRAREGDGPTLIECLTDRLPDDPDQPADALSRLDATLLYEGYAEPEELS